MTAATTRLRLVVVGVLGATAGLVGFSAPAAAKACPAGTGVTVVVNSSVGCDRNGGGTAASNFKDAGHTLKYAAKEPGFVCRVNGSPASDPCGKASPANAYWALFWSDGRSGSWAYASSGVGSVKVPKGGWVAFVFQTSNARTYPSMRPVTKATAKPSSSGGGSTGGTSTRTTAERTRAQAPSPRPTRTSTDAPEPDEETSTSPPRSAPSTAATPTADGGAVRADVAPASEDETTGSAVPWWVAAGLGLLLAGAAAAVALRRRSQRTG